MRKLVALDIDDVCCLFTPHAFKFHGKEMPEKINYWCVDTMNKELCEGWFSKHIALQKKFWQTLKPLSNPKDIDFEFDYYISSFPIGMFDERIKWLRKHGFPDKPLIVASDKLDACKRLGVEVLIDDKPATIEILNEAGLTGIHFITDYAGFEPIGDKVITNLNQVKQYL